jgi:hypothetical protein
MSSPLSEEKNDSASALSQHWPVRPTESVTCLLLGEGGVGGRGVLAAAVGVEDQARLRVPDRERVGQRVGDQFRAQVIGQGVADDPPGGDIDDRR